MKKDLFLLYISVISLGISVFVYFQYLGYKYNNNIVNNDPLNKKLVNIPFISKNCCSMWPISHFIAFALFGYIWPQYVWTLFILGIFWEIIEVIMNYLETEKWMRGSLGRAHGRMRTGGKVEYSTWWEASEKDILFNGVGILCGMALRHFCS